MEPETPKPEPVVNTVMPKEKLGIEAYEVVCDEPRDPSLPPIDQSKFVGEVLVKLRPEHVAVLDPLPEPVNLDETSKMTNAEAEAYLNDMMTRHKNRLVYDSNDRIPTPSKSRGIGIWIINILALISAISLASISGYFSIIGLTAIFAASFWPICIMGSVLEVGKLVTASWLYRHWREAPGMLKGYLTGAVLVLMLITSMGIFGYLSKAHIDQRVDNLSTVTEQYAGLDEKIKNEKALIDDDNIRINQIDTAISEMTKRGRTASALSAVGTQRKERQALVDKRTEESNQMVALMKQKSAATTQENRVQAEVGPLRYVAELVYGSADEAQLERAVRWMILLIVAVFDPLAVLLLIAANVGLQSRRD